MIKLDEQRIVELWNEGKSVGAIANTIGHRSVRGRIKQLLLDKGFAVEKRYASNTGTRKDKIVNENGYVLQYVPKEHWLRPYATKGPNKIYMLQHRYVMAEALERPLSPTETVHHINGIRDDNRLENLQLRVGRHGKGVALTCRACGSHDIEHSLLGD